MTTSTSPRHWRWPALLLLLALLLLIGLLLWVTRPTPAALLVTLPRQHVETVAVVRRELRPEQQIYGRLQPARHSELRLLVSGEVIERLVEPGVAVSSGDHLLQLRRDDFVDAEREAAARLAEERAAIQRDRELLQLAQRAVALQQAEMARLEQLGSESLASRSQLGEARQRLLQQQAEAARLQFTVTSAPARLTLRQVALQQAQRNLQRTTLVAPFSGRVARVHLDQGDYTTPATVAVELIDDRQLDLYMELPTAVTHPLTAALPVQAAGRQWLAELVATTPLPQPTTHTWPLRLRLPADPTLYAGMLASATLPLPPRTDVLTVPAAALLREEGEAWLFRLDAATQRLEQLAVSVGIRYRGLYEVSAPTLRAGDRVVARDVALLTDGQAVVVGTIDDPPT